MLPFIGKSLLKGLQLRQCQTFENKNKNLEIYGLEKFVSHHCFQLKLFFHFSFFEKKRMNPSRKRNDESQASKMHVIPEKLVYLKNFLGEHFS
jgi:hypothetical protein